MENRQGQQTIWERIKTTWVNNLWTRIAFIIGGILIIISFFMPPQGIIDGSVITSVGELMISSAVIQFYDSLNKNTKANLRIRDLELQLEKEREAN